ncbi:MAG TPA: GNAT family N-acetyltransferase [Falsiroseomonas sp.]|jgi:predicted N-acetyltransferase YhbS|nr:GNAT family N-acetyltransferase [Falsiroseomonas sp.]
MDTHQTVAAGGTAGRCITLRPGEAGDAEACGRIIHDAFAGIAAAHGFAKDIASREAGTGLARALLGDPKTFAVVAEMDGAVVGSNFVGEGDEVRGVGPLTVDPAWQGARIGRRLVRAVLDRSHGATSVRLVQDAFNTRSLSVYASLGFEVKAPLFLVRGKPQGDLPAGAEVRPMTEADIPACDALCHSAHAMARTHELRMAVRHLSPMVLERRGRILGYLTAPGSWAANHGVAETEQDMAGLLAGAAAAQRAPVSLLLPGRQAGLLRWCLAQGMQVVKPMTLMSRGAYRVPARCWVPSALY